jgi:hypothetical protein
MSRYDLTGGRFPQIPRSIPLVLSWTISLATAATSLRRLNSGLAPFLIITDAGGLVADWTIEAQAAANAASFVHTSFAITSPRYRGRSGYRTHHHPWRSYRVREWNDFVSLAKPEET